MALDYPANPPDVPADLAVPSPRYKRHVWLAAGALIAFVALYAGSVFWLGRLVSLAVSGIGSVDFFAILAMGGPSLFLLAFLVKGLFFVRRGDVGAATEITAAEEPVLFQFIHRVADDVGAPRPHRVFLTPDVNASVFYDLSLRELVFPSKKNLNIGLGLVNVLTLDEFKAVLAHEFGHFAQRSMALGTWVYVSGQVIGAVVGRRDAFDTFIRGLSRFDLRVAWIGWGLGLLVWAIRAVFDSAYRLLLLVDRALSREMEFQADLVAVSVTGSDSLIHALRRLGPADQALNRAYEFATEEGRAGRPIADVYRAQSDILAHLRRVIHDPMLGAVPERPARNAAAHRIFSPEIAEAPRMWSTHPPNHEREEAAKRRYVPSKLDGRSAWSVFKNPAALASRVTRSLYEKNMPAVASTACPAPEVTEEALTKAWTRPALAGELMGVYTDRSPVLWARDAAGLSEPVPAGREAVLDRLGALYPPSLVAVNRERRAAESQVVQLEALAEGFLTAPGGIIRYRGEAIERAALPAVLDVARGDRTRLRDTLQAHDRAVRSAHVGAGRELGQGWEEHLRGLTHALHYFSHLHANVLDAHGLLLNTWAVAAADGTISEREIPPIIVAANEAQAALAAVYEPAGTVRLPPGLTTRLGKDSWSACLGETLGLPPATRDHLAANWLEVEGGWVGSASRHLDEAITATLDELLQAEAHVARCLRTGEDPGAAPAPAVVPARYPTLHPGSERKRTRKLGAWDRFQTADGLLPGFFRFAAAAAVLAPPAWFGLHFGTAELLIHNGLATPVLVQVRDRAIEVPAHGERKIDIDRGDLVLRTTLADGTPVEEREESAPKAFAPYVYNVAGASAFYRTHVIYGAGEPPDARPLGAAIWFQPDLDYVGTVPPESIEGSAGTVKSVLTGTAGLAPSTVLGAAGPEEKVAIVSAHLRWDPPESTDFGSWVMHAGPAGVDAKALISERARGSKDPALGRQYQFVAQEEACAEHTAAAAAEPNNGDLVYLATRCLPDGPESDAAFLEAAARFPESPWLRWVASGIATKRAEWPRAAELLAEAFPDALEAGAGEMRLLVARRVGAELDVQTRIVSSWRGGEDLRAYLRAEATGEAGDLGNWLPEAAALVHMAAGDLAAAEKVTTMPPTDRALVACSDGASDALRAELVSLEPIPGTPAALCRLAVLSSTRALTDADYAALDPMGPEFAGRVKQLLQAPPEAVVATGDSLVEGSDLPTRGFLRMAGVVRLGDAAPQVWRDEARALTLPWSRPYLRP